MANISAVHRHAMISFTPVTQRVCAKFNNCDRQNFGVCTHVQYLYEEPQVDVIAFRLLSADLPQVRMVKIYTLQMKQI